MSENLGATTSWSPPASKADGSNPLARVDLYGDEDGYLIAICDCNTHLDRVDNNRVNLQDLVIAAHEHAKVCPLHLANLEGLG